MKILIVIGTRPEAIKMVSVIQTLRKDKFFKVFICSTGQHKQMLNDVFKKFKIIPHYNLNLMKKNQSLSYITEGVIHGLTKIIEKINPALVLVHGDTISSFAASIASYYKMIPVAHVEAGLRTKNLFSPWPEEGSRRLIDTISSIHFCPTKLSKNNLINEGFDKKSLFVTGNTVIDTLLITKKIINKDKFLKKTLQANFDFLSPKRKLILVTAHRRENFGNPFENICEALIDIAKKNENVDIVYPIHSNPNIREPGYKYLSKKKNIHLLKPLDYYSFVYLMEKSYLIMTDSGGIQEEAPSFKKPIIVLREETERVEAVKDNLVKLVGTNKNRIIREVSKLLKSERYYKKFLKKRNPYGDGKASRRISKILKERFKR